MKDHLTPEKVERIVAKTIASFRHDECRTCDCFLGFLVQLEIDSDQNISGVVDAHKVPKTEMHGCLGCNPCPPGAAFAEYLKMKQGLLNDSVKDKVI